MKKMVWMVVGLVVVLITMGIVIRMMSGDGSVLTTAKRSEIISGTELKTEGNGYVAWVIMLRSMRLNSLLLLFEVEGRNIISFCWRGWSGTR